MSHTTSMVEILMSLFSIILYITIKCFQFFYTFAVFDYVNYVFITRKVNQYYPRINSWSIVSG